MDKMVNFIAFCLPLGVFLFFGIVGYAALSLTRTQRHIIQNILLAPAIGLASTLLLIFCFSRAGFPVGHVAIPLSLFLVFSSLVTLQRKKPPFPLRSYLPFACILLVGLFLVGQPLLQFGFNWISYGNDDMLNYALAAQLLLNHGYLEVPDSAVLTQGRDYSLYYWFLHVIVMDRAGSQLLLAWLSRLTQLSTLQIFMPLIVGLHLTVISATGAMVYQAKSWRSTALIACLLLAASGFASLGTLYELVAQVGGLVLLVAICTLLFQPAIIHQKHQILRQSILVSVVASALMIIYCELIPFLGLAFIIYLFTSLVKRAKLQRSFFLIISLSLIFSFIFLNTYWINVIAAINRQLGTLAMRNNAMGSLFPYFLVPSGMADLWNFQKLSQSSGESWFSMAIILGFSLSILTGLVAVMQMTKRYIPAIMLAIMTIFSLNMFRTNNGFPLFKLMMYMQPFLYAVLALGLLSLVRRRILQALIIGLLVWKGIAAHHFYVDCSRGGLGQSFVELPGASQSHLVDEIKKLASELPDRSSTVVVTDVPNIITAKIIALHLQNTKTFFYSDSFFTQHLTENAIKNLSAYQNIAVFEKVFPHTIETTKQLNDNIYRTIKKLKFSLHDPNQPTLKTTFLKPEIKLNNNTYLLSNTPQGTVLNRRQFLNVAYQNFSLTPIQNVSNHLSFINSTLGQYYYMGDPEYISLYNLEKDYFFKNNSFSWLGRYLLFQVTNPSKKVRLALSISMSLNHDNSNLLPSAKVIGTERVSLPLVGRGSARVFSPVVIPQLVDHSTYLTLDMAQNGKNPTSGNDHRLLIGLARDISLVSDEEYQRITPPSHISAFPGDLADPNLEYSGMYEDGWISETAFFRLVAPQEKTTLTLTGIVPKLGNESFNSELSIYLNGKKIAIKQLTLGSFNIELPLYCHPGPQKIELYFSNQQALPTGDDRPVAAKIEFIGFI